jgi:hypothetical protein
MIGLPSELKKLNNDQLKEYHSKIRNQYTTIVKNNNHCTDQSRLCIEDEFKYFIILDAIFNEEQYRKYSIKNTKKKIRKHKVLHQ